MDQPTPTLAHAMPRALVLSYIAQPGTPTHVRRVAAIALYILGTIGIVAGLMLAALLVDWSWDYFGRGVGLPYLIGRHTPECLGFALALACTLCTGPIQILLARFVNRGNRFSCYTAFLSLLPLACVVFLASALVGAGAIMNGLGLFGSQPDWPMLLWLLATAFGVLLLLALKDLAAFLLWIARTPSLEKPPVRFLPARDPRGPNPQQRA